MNKIRETRLDGEEIDKERYGLCINVQKQSNSTLEEDGRYKLQQVRGRTTKGSGRFGRRIQHILSVM